MCFDLSAIRNIIRSWCGGATVPLHVSAEEKAKQEAEREKIATARLEYLTRHTVPHSTPINVPAKPALRGQRELRSTEQSERRNETIISDWNN